MPSLPQVCLQKYSSRANHCWANCHGQYSTKLALCILTCRSQCINYFLPSVVQIHCISISNEELWKKYKAYWDGFRSFSFRGSWCYQKPKEIITFLMNNIVIFACTTYIIITILIFILLTLIWDLRPLRQTNKQVCHRRN